MIFASPAVLLLLLLLIPFTFLVVWNYRMKRRIMREFMSATAEARMVVRGGREIDFFKSILLLLALVFLILALARPQWGERFESVHVRGLEIVFLLDTSASMNAEDLQPDRLEVAKNLIVTIVDALKTDLVSQVNFAAVAYVQCPLTMDYDAFKLMAMASQASPAEEQGTDFAKGFELALSLFKKTRGSQKLLLLITDGEDLENNWPGALQELRKENVIVFTVGVGSPAGAPIPVRDAGGRTSGWKKDARGNIVKSVLDESALMRIAAAGQGRYYRLSAAAGMAPFIDILKGFERNRLAQKVRRRRIERFQYPLLLAVLLLAAEMALSNRKISWPKKSC
jgi:Ca-activated chloride channel family protein